MANIIEIIVRAKDEASAAINKSTQSLQDLESAAKTAAIPFAGLAAVGTAVIAKTTLTAARTEELGVVVENLGRVSGYSEEQLSATETSIKELGITTQGARTIMSRFMGAELDLADAAKIARAAQDLAVIGTQDSSVAAENLTYAIASMQPRVLRQYGLFLNLNDVYEKTAATLGKTTEELTENEKRQGMLNEVLLQAGNFTGTYEAAMSTAGKQLRSMNRLTETASELLGKHYLPYLGLTIQTVSDLIEKFSSLDEDTQGLIASTIMYATVISAGVAGTMGLVVATSKLVTALQALKLVMVAHPILILPTALAILATAEIQARLAEEKLRKEILEGARTRDEYIDQITQMREGWKSAGGEARRLVSETEELRKAQLQEADAQEWLNKKIQAAEPWMKQQAEELKEINALIEGHVELQKQAAAVMSYDMASALASNILGLRENMDRYRELEETVITAHVDMGDKVYQYNKDVEKYTADRTAAMLKLEQDWADDRGRIQRDAWMRSAEETQALYETQAIIEANELRDFNAKWDAKNATIEETYQHQTQLAWAAAEERRKAEEAARQAEMEALEAAQEERLMLFALEMAETKGLLKVPLKGWEEVQLSAQEYLDLVSAGIIPASDDVTTYMGQALFGLRELWDETGQQGGEALTLWQTLVSSIMPDVMNLGTTTEDTAMAIDTAWHAHAIDAILDSGEAIEDLDGDMIDLARTTYQEAGDMEKSIDGYTIELGKSITKTQDLEETTDESMKNMRTDIGSATRAMDTYAESIQHAINLWDKLLGMAGGGGPSVPAPPAGVGPGLQAGLTYVPATMLAEIHRGEAVLTKPQAEQWRQGYPYTQQVNIYLGDSYGIDGVREAVEKAIEEEGRFVP